MTFEFSPVLDTVFLGNSMYLWLISLLTFAGLLIAFRLLQSIGTRLLRSIARRPHGMSAGIVASFLERVPAGVWILLALLLALRMLALPALAEKIITGGLLIVVVSFAVLLAQRILSYELIKRIPRLHTGDGASLPAVIQVTLSFVLWTIGVLLILSNLGINVISLVAGLGIGGIAVALAAQNILGDIFSSYSLYLDQPFREGDFITTGIHSGTVRKIGLKTTRIQALDGEEIIISNQELTSARVQNFKPMQERRVVLNFGVTYDTPVQVMRAIPGIVKEIIEKKEGVRFDRSHFSLFGPSSLDFVTVYHMLDADYTKFMDTQQAINLEIMERFEKDGIAFAFPTQTVHVVRNAAQEA
jgi:small-conductance mechanosensitive channel